MAENFRYFAYSDFACKCGCGLNNQSIEHIRKLDIARSIAGIPFEITRGCSCPEHNKAVGGTDTSSHLIGHATDILADTSRKRYKILEGFYIANYLYGVGFERIEIGYKKTRDDKTRQWVHRQWVHVDDDTSKPQEVLWIKT